MKTITLNNKEFNNSIEAIQYALSVAKKVACFDFNENEMNISFSKGEAHVWFHTWFCDMHFRLAVQMHEVYLCRWIDGRGWTKIDSAQARKMLENIQ